jgi:hypothetical protein
MYRIMWAPAALTELNAIWNGAPVSDDQLLIWAVSDLTFRLERDPENEGESRYHNMRVTFSWPLAVWFEVVGTDTVWIYHIWRHRRA